MDDEPDILEQAKIFLESEEKRLKVETTSSAKEALKMVEKREWDAIISDYKMPDMDGLQLLRKAREECGDVPFIILTGRGREEVAMEALNRGADRYIMKDGDPQSVYDDLARAVVQEIEHHRTREREEVLHSLLRHDLRNKAQIAEGYMELIREMGDSKEKEYVEKAIRSIRDGINLIEKVRTLRRLGEKTPKEVEIDSQIRDIILDYRDQAKEEGVEIRYQGEECRIRAGPLFEELISNLVENAIRHSQGSEIRISHEKEEGGCLMSVEDDGIGIPDEDKQRVLERGFKKGDMAGSGLGLFIAREIAESYGGSIEVKDSELGGARFEVRLGLAD